jgi:transcription antitermination factor NusG
MGFGRADGAWFAIQVRPKYETFVSNCLRNKGYEEFLPLAHSSEWLIRSSVRPTAPKPLYPGYLFCRVDINLTGKIISTPGVIRILSFGRSPVPVDPQEMANMRRISDSGLGVYSWPYARTGDRVIVKDGPLRGMEGVLFGQRQAGRLIVSVTLLQRSAAVEMNSTWLEVVDVRANNGENRATWSPTV